MRRMDALRKLTLLMAAAVVAVALAAGPTVGAEDAPEQTPEQTSEQAPAGEEDEGHRRPIAETPRDRLGLLLLGSMVAGGGLAWINARRQLRGERPQASGDFRWR